MAVGEGSGKVGEGRGRVGEGRGRSGKVGEGRGKWGKVALGEGWGGVGDMLWASGGKCCFGGFVLAHLLRNAHSD